MYYLMFSKGVARFLLSLDLSKDTAQGWVTLMTTHGASGIGIFSGAGKYPWRCTEATVTFALATIVHKYELERGLGNLFKRVDICLALLCQRRGVSVGCCENLTSDLVSHAMEQYGKSYTGRAGI